MLMQFPSERVYLIRRLLIIGLLFAAGGETFAAQEQSRGWGSSWTEPHSAEEKTSRDLLQRLETALHARDWTAVARVFDEAERILPTSPEIPFARGTIAMIRHHYEEAVANFNRALSLLPRQNSAVMASSIYYARSYANALLGAYQVSRADLERAISLNKNNPAAHNAYAWLLATCPEASIRDGKRALEFARAANRETRNQNSSFVDTLAAAEAEVGDFRAAVKDQQRAVSMAKGDRITLQQHLQTYLEGKPLHIPPDPPRPSSSSTKAKKS
jgi:tetratricopeptide (TPR) repeat protein